jgi:hypothetical protein
MVNSNRKGWFICDATGKGVYDDSTIINKFVYVSNPASAVWGSGE